MGGYRKVYELAQNLEKLGHEPTIFLPKLNYKSIPVRYVMIPTLDLPVIRPIIFNLLLGCYLFIAALRERPSLFYSRPINSFIPLLVAKLCSTFFVAEVNGDQCYNLRLIGAHRIKIGLIKIIEHINFKFADRIIPITTGLKKMLMEEYGIGENKISIIESGSNLDLFKPLDQKYCKDILDLDKEISYIGFLGTFFKYQGIDTLIESANDVIEKVPGVKFLIVGDGAMRAAWMQKSQKLGLEDYFIFPGQAPYREVALYINAMTLCVAPFTADRGEASPLKLFDYFACGKPVVSSDIPSVHQVLVDSEAAVIVPPDDPAALAQAVIALLNNQKRMETFGQNGRRFVVAKYSWESQVRILMSGIEHNMRKKIGKCHA
jgi:glycosyltransferase involved in cell wall biosynthesis